MTGLTCAEFVELVTDYLDGALDLQTRQRFDEHAAACPGCDTYLDQIRETVAQVGRLTPDHLQPEARDRLLAAFHDWTGTRVKAEPPPKSPDTSSRS